MPVGPLGVSTSVVVIRRSICPYNWRMSTPEIDAAGELTPPELVVDEAPAAGRRIAMVGRLGGMNRRQAASVIRSLGGTVVTIDDADLDWVVIGAEESPLAEAELLTPEVQSAAADGFVEIVPEADLWQRLGLVDAEQSVRQYYTPATLADLLGVSVRVIRRWHRLGLIHAVRTLHRLPYFDFAEVASARRLAQWIAAGASPAAIERRLVELVEVLPGVRRPLDQLSVLVEGKHVLLRGGEGLLEPGGQLRFDFDAADDEERGDCDFVTPPTTLAIWQEPGDAVRSGLQTESPVQDELLEAAFDAEDAGDFQSAIDRCHSILARDGPRADICFQIAELLYRTGEVVAAQERYWMAIEIDPEFVEARASVGNVLSELKRFDLAIAAYQGALRLHEDYADVHFNLARALEEIGNPDAAIRHWKRFLDLAPQSHWAPEAASRLEMSRDD